MFWKKSKWSEVPGCFERHLQRRDGNVLFSSERRTVSRGEIAEAQRRDKIDQDKFVETVKKLGAALDNSENTNPLSTLRDSSSLQRIQALLEEAASIGGNIQNAIRLLENTEESITQSLNELTPEGKELLEKSKSYSITARIPFIAQLKRKDTPILKSEVVPTLLSEDLGQYQSLVS